jgi:hypothetical protein
MPNNAARDCATPAAELSGLIALVTGGTSGIGQACARL